MNSSVNARRHRRVRRTVSFPAVITLAALFAASWFSNGDAQPLDKRTLAEGITLELLELRRVNSKVVRLIFAIDNRTGETVDPRIWGLTTASNASAIRLLDMENAIDYRAGSAGGTCLCSRGNMTVGPKSRREYWSDYAAPPAKVTKLTVYFAGISPVDDVPIGK